MRLSTTPLTTIRNASFAASLVMMCALGVVSSPQALSFALLVGALVVPFTRWRWPLATVVGIAAALVVASFSEVLPIGVIALGPFAAYVTRRHLPVPLRDVATAGLLVGDIVAIGFVVPALRELEPTDRIPYVVWSVTLLTVALLFGELRRRADESAEQELARQRAEFERAAQEQRAHLAREIHDIVTHSLTVIVAQADGARFAATPEAKDEALHTIGNVGRDSLRQMRGVVELLRDPEQRPLEPTTQLDIDGLVATSRAGGLNVAYTAEGTPPEHLAPATALTVQRIVQESLTNAMKHGTGHAELSVRWGADTVVVEMTNPVAPGATTRPGHGVEGMRQRAALSGGTVTASATPAGTWTTTARIPLNS
ncbi:MULTISPECIES: sensor histidine kinase [Corynebacterium]|uniref:histidine kinase n=1 Tax=Corynebacterium coyleae TaxID=53374 RepID=A0AAP7CD46_9CORY|nr:MULTISPECIES: histidine kinase [Corynebacterium]MDK8663269.1 histidine kinase [Corynebacterium coyleae]MDK8706385.1 histidine kinase [Corynebacterium coyleae]MDK8733224.1 histidine kinase [Corynebacterium coyleae]MDK8822701.1 histidine kinase [Corynebacterium coyleae]MDK8892427.1 histidine kinase [Corynebacterium coyleae]